MKRTSLWAIILVSFLCGIMLAQQMTVKDSDTNVLMQVNDEGSVGSISLPAGSAPASPGGKLYNQGGSLYWNGNELGTAGSAGGWTDAGSTVRQTSSGDEVAIGLASTNNAKMHVYDTSHNYTLRAENTTTTYEAACIYALASGATQQTYAVQGVNYSSAGTGLRGSGNSRGVWGSSSSTSGTGVFGIATSSSGTNYGVLGHTESSSGYAGYFEGRGYFSGRVGIGTSSPAYPLEVEYRSGGDGILIDGTGNWLSTLMFQENGVDKAYMLWHGQYDFFTINTMDNGPINMTFRDSGVAIGKDIPTTTLDVDGVITATGGNSTNWNTAYSWGNHASAGYMSGSLSTDEVPRWNGSSLVSGSIEDDGSIVGINGSPQSGSALYVNGKLGVSSFDPTAYYDVGLSLDGRLTISTSSIRYKYDVHPMDIEPADVLNLEPIRFKHKESGEEDFGLIAEEVDKHVKDLVVYDREGRPNGIKYSKLAIFLLEVVKEQQDELTEQRARIEMLEKQLR